MKKIALLFLVALAACGKDGGETAAPSIVPPSDVMYDEVLSSATSISVYWNTAAATGSGAVAFTVQLSKDLSDEGAVHSRRIKSYEPRPCDTFCFTGLEKYSRYYVRVRAEYGTGNSEWVYLGAPTVVETGTGPVDGPVEATGTPSVRLKAANAGSLAVEWSVTGFGNMELDLGRNYKVFLYSDSSCSNLIVSWVLNASEGVFQGVPAGAYYDPDFPAFLFTGLTPSTDYWVKVSDITGAVMSSGPVKVSTVASKVVVPGASPVAAGEYALYEDFEELIWGGGASAGAAAYNSLMRAVFGHMSKATGDNPVETPEKFFVCNQNNEFEFFQCMPSLAADTRLKDWSERVIDGNPGQVLAQSGSIKLGAGSKKAEIVSPALVNLQGAAKVEIGFDARNYYVRESRDIYIDIIGTDSAVRATYPMQLEGGYRLKPYSLTVNPLLPGEKIGIRGDGRMSLDNVYVKVLSY